MSDIKWKGCKRLDYDEKKYPACKLIKKDIGWWWERQNIIEGDPINVQFCGQGRGRINGIFQCINNGEMPCFEAQEAGEKEHEKD